MNLTQKGIAWARTDIWAALSLAAYIFAAYLCLANLDYVSIWHDEGPVSVVGKNLLEQGDIVGWDGRNLVGSRDGITLNEELRDVAPPMQYVLTAAGFAAFGIDEFGARIVHALAGILALGLFYLVLRQHFARHPRLVFFMFLFSAWSAQLLLYFRQARYYSVAVLTMMAAFYLYERYWQTRRPAYLAALTTVLMLGFLNHYAIGTAIMLALAVWHLLFRIQGTTKQEWVMFCGCGAIVGGLGLWYLYFIGLVGADREASASFLTGDFGEYQGTAPLAILQIWTCIRDLFQADWVSWPVFVWFAYALAVALREKRDRTAEMGFTCASSGHVEETESCFGDGRIFRRGDERAEKPEREKPHSGTTPSWEMPILETGRVVLLGVLFAVIMSMVSPQPVWLDNTVLDLRYYVPGLMLLLAMKGLFAEWVWRKSRAAGGLAVAALLFTSVGAMPFNMAHTITEERTIGTHFFQFVREVHRPYEDAIGKTSDYLLEHAAQDELVLVLEWHYRDALAFYVGHRVLLCGVLSPGSRLARDWNKEEALDERHYMDECLPDWIVVFGPLVKELQEHPDYMLAERLDVFAGLTQRPELNFHLFEPLIARPRVHILRRRDAGPG